MWLFPLAATLVAVAFAGMTAKQAVERRRPYLVAWTIALAMFAVASFAAFLGVDGGWTPALFRLYWLFGAILTVPYLALGELLLLFRGKRVRAAMWVVVAAMTVFAAIVVFTSHVEGAALAGRDLPLGKEAFGRVLLAGGEGPEFHGAGLSYRLAQIYSYPSYVILVAGAVYSAIRMRRTGTRRGRALGTLLIAVGATLVAIGSGVGAGLDVVPVFSICLVAGIAVMFLGFLRASRPPGHRPPPPDTSPRSFRSFR
jgi:hypothetical protein